jgi:hypothetical protein
MNHHAQLVRTVEVSTYQHPETTATVLNNTLDTMGIGDVRAVTAQAQLRPATDGGQVFVIAASFITHEAQNALLKLFEEPPVDTAFVLVVPPAFQLLPTLQSRIGQETTIADSRENQTWTLFLAASYADRLQQVDSWQKSKDPQWLSQMVAGVHSVSSQEVELEAMQVLQFVGQKLQTRGASNKMLLEHLALVLPLRK